MAEQQLPVWNSKGVEPPANLQRDGWQPGVKPPAQYFDWLFNRAYKCLEELQAITEALETNKANGEDLTTLNNKVTQHLDETTQRIFCIKSSNQTITNSVETFIGFDSLEKSIPSVDFAQLTTDRKVEILQDGEYEIKIGVCFTVNVNGARRVMPHHIAFSNTVKATDAPTYVSSSYRNFFTAGTVLDLKAFQSSGVALDIIGANTRAVISRVG